MERYDYQKAIREDIKSYLDENFENINEILKTDRDELYDRLFLADSVTGNGSGSYTFNYYEAENNLCGNLDLLADAFEELGFQDNDIVYSLRSPESCDVIVRCHLLYQALDEVLEEMQDELESEDALNNIK